VIKWRRYSKKLPPSHFVILNVALGIGHFVMVLAAGAFLPMLPYVAGSIGKGLPFAVWGQSNYVAAMGAAFLIARPIMRRFGARNAAIAAYVTFALAGFLVVGSLSIYPLYTAARTIQGLAAGLGIAPSFSLLLEHFKRAKHKAAASLWGLAAFTPFSVGPALGGYFAYVLGDWRLLFFVFSGLSLLVAGVVWALLGEWKSPREENFPLGRYLELFALFSGAVIALQAFFNVGILTDLTSREYASWWVLATLLFLAWLFWVCNSRIDEPLVEFSIFRYRNYAFGLFLLGIAFMGVQGSIVQYVLRIQSVEGYTAWHAGLLFLPLFLFSKPLSVVSQSLIHHGYDPRLLACLSFIGFAVSFWWMGEYVRPATWETLLWPQFLEGAALGVFLISMTAVVLSNVPESEQIHAVDIINSVRTLMAALAITLSDILWDRYAASARSHLTSPDASNTREFLAGLPSLSATSSDPLFHLFQVRIATQSGWITFNAMFHALAACFALFAVLIWATSSTHITHRVSNLERIVETLGEES
jgi:DHA2 family multidrug resistance protein